MRYVTIVDGKTVFVDGNDEYNDPYELLDAITEAERVEQELLDQTGGSWSDPENYSAGEIISMNDEIEQRFLAEKNRRLNALKRDMRYD